MIDLVWSGLYSFILNLLIGFFVYKQNNKKKLNILFALFSLTVSGWSVGSFLINIIPNKEIALQVLRFNYLFAVWLPAIYIHFVYVFTQDNSKSATKKLKLSYLSSFILTLFVFTPYFIKSLRVIPSSNFLISVPGPIYFIFFIFFGIGMWEVLSHTFIRLRRSSGAERTQYRYITIANGIAIFAGFEYFSRVFGLLNSPPLDDYILVTYLLVLAYAIAKHQLMDIEVVVRRTAVFAGLFAFVYGTFTVVTVLGQEFFKNALGWNQWVSTIPTVLIITFSLRPLEIWLTNATEKFLFQKKYDYRDLLKTFTDEVLTVLDLNQLPQQTVSGLIRILKLESASVLLKNKEDQTYKIVASQGIKETGLILKEDSTLITYLKATQHHILKDKSVDKMDPGSLKDTFKSLNAQLCLPISLHDDLIGILSLGMKKSGEDYTQEDIDILSTLARTEAIAISNAQLFDELSKTQAEAAQREKMAVIGTLAAGINHEICNPLGIVRGHCEMFLLNLRDGFYVQKTQEEILKISSDIMAKVIKETDRATSITKKLSGFAKPSKRSDLEEVIIEKEVEEVIGLLGHDLKLNNIELHQDFPKDFPVILADKKQMQEILFNIIRNAAQAMDKKQGKIALSGFKDNGAAVIRIADNGSGIPKDKVGQIFNPFYTTKAPGKGTGLGLFIVKQVVEKNKGVIAVESEEGVGTTFTLRFPTAAHTIASQS